MKKPTFEFDIKDLGDKVRITLLVNGKKDHSIYRLKENSEFSFSLNEAKDIMKANYLISEDGGEL